MASTNITGIALPELQFVLTTAGNDYILSNAPKGWEDTLISQDKDKEYYAMKRTYSLPFDFVKDGAYLLREQRYLYGIQASARLTINKLDAATQTYQLLTRGEIDFANWNNQKDIVTVNVMDSGIESKIKAYGDVTYEFDMADGFDLELTPLSLEERTDFIFIQPPNAEPNYFPQLNIVNNPNLSIVPSTKQVDYAKNNSPNWADDGSWFLKPNIDTEVHLEGFIEGGVGGRSGTYEVQLRDTTGTVVLVLYQRVQPNTAFFAFNAPIDITFNAISGRYYYIYVNRTVDGSGFTSLFNISTGQLSATYNTISPATTIKAFRPDQLFQKLIDKMNGSPYPTLSNHLSTTWYQLSITSGDAIRSLPNPKLKTSWNDFWQSINAETNACFYDYNGDATLEAKAQAYKRTLPIIDVGEVKDWSDGIYKEEMPSKIVVGYEDQNYDETGGRTEFNARQEYTTPITRVQKTLDLLSKYRADSLGIELLRVQLDGQDSADNKGDNECWFIYVKDTPEISGAYQPEGVEGYDSVTGVKEGAYNIKLSPKQMLYRWGDYLASMFDRLSGGKLFFASATKDVGMVTVSLTGRRIAEADNVNIINLGAPLFLPYTVTFKCALPTNTWYALQAAPNGYILFHYQGVEYRGYILSIGIDPARNEEQEIKVLLTPDNDLLTLIK